MASSFPRNFRGRRSEGVRIDVAEKELARMRSEIQGQRKGLDFRRERRLARSLALKKKSILAREIVQINDELLGYTKIKHEDGEVFRSDVNLSRSNSARQRKSCSWRNGIQGITSCVTGTPRLSPDMSFAIEGDLPSEAPALPDKKP